jgi:ComF family protein
MPLPQANWLFVQLQNLFFPPACVVCQAAGAVLCPSCEQAVQPIEQPICRICGRLFSGATGVCLVCAAESSPTLRLARSAALHIDPLRQMIHALKYENRPELASLLARYLVAAFDYGDWRKIAPTIDVVAPTPMDARRQRQRGYNQADLLAAEFARRTRLLYEPHLLRRTRFVRPQVGLNAAQRQENVKDAFVAERSLAGRTILLIDDVFTTGATVRACAQAALAADAANVYALVLATPLYEDPPHQADPITVAEIEVIP